MDGGSHRPPVLARTHRAGLSLDHQLRFLRALRSESFAENEYVVQEGDLGDRFFIIVQGEVVVTKRSADGHEEVITHLYEVGRSAAPKARGAPHCGPLHNPRRDTFSVRRHW